MLNQQIINQIESNGFEIKNTMTTSENENGLFDQLYSVSYNNTDILYLRKNENETFNTIEFLNYPSAFPKLMKHETLERVIEILQSVISINFKTA